MKEDKEGTPKSGSGKKVKSRKQAVSIALSEAPEAGAKVPEDTNPSRGTPRRHCRLTRAVPR
jgi:hypothetical protein